MQSRSFAKFLLLFFGLFLLTAALVADRKPLLFRSTEKAFFADEKTAGFVRPGLVMQVTKADIGADGTIKAWVKLNDPQGLPLDRLGAQTPGAISISFLASYLPAGESQYVSYITRQRVTNGNTATQATSENTGTWQQVADGEYVYTFAAKAPPEIDRNATHTIGIYGSRNLTEFDLGTNRADHAFNFVPSGAAVTHVRDVVRTSTCNKCHDQLGLHGGNRRSIQVCVLCHSPQTTEPGTGNTVDLKVMVHKIHMGSSLPSVATDKKKYMIGSSDFSDVVNPSPNMACGVCHESKQVSGAVQADNWKTNPSRAACGSCHEKANFDTGVGHAGGPMTSDAQCSQCHTAAATSDFDASVPGAHVVPEQSSLLDGIALGIESVTNASPGKNPVVIFTLKNKTGAPVALSSLSTLRLYMGGPTTDIPTYTREDALRAGDLGGGRFVYTFLAALPATTKGSWQFGLEGYRTATLMKGTVKEKSVRESGLAKVMTVSVDGKPMQARRTPVSTAKCNSCHLQIGFHGGSRNNTQLCTFCHNPSLVDGTTGQSWNFPNFIHRIHGEEVRYPGNITTCTQCHDNNSQFLPLQETMMPVASKTAPISPVPPTTNACTSCHNELPTWRHAVSNTNALGESCDVCHGPAGEFSVAKAHAQ